MRPLFPTLHFFKTLVFLLACVSLSISAMAQSKSNKGKEFWVGFMFHYEGTSAGHSLYITSDSNTSGTVSVPGESWSKSFTVSANNLTIVTIPSSVAYNGCSNCITPKGVKIVSQDDIVVYAHQYLGNQSDATLVLPTKTLGKEYFAASYYQSSASNTRGRSTFLIVSTQDKTVVKISPKIAIQKGSATSSTGFLPANTPYTVTLNKGEIYQGYGFGASSSDDVTGTSFEVIDTGATANCRKIAVFTGSSYARVGSNCSSRFSFNSGDNLYEQMYPTNSWGKRFILVPALGRNGDDFRFIAKEDNTEIVVYKATGGAPDIFYVNKGDFAQIDNEPGVRSCQSSKPIMAVQYQRTARCDGGGNRTGDPSMTVLNPLEQTLKDITVYSSRYYDIDNHYINVVMPTFATGSFRVDGATASFSSVPNNPFYSYARIAVKSGNHRLTANEGFIATAYGEGEYESYGYAAGASVKSLTSKAEVANSTQNNKVTSCIGRLTSFKGSAEYAVVKWEWDFGDGSIDSVQNPSHVFKDTGTYQVRLYTYKPSFDGCSLYDSAFIDVAVYGLPEARIATSNLCDGLKATFTDKSIMPSPDTKLVSIWSLQGQPGLKYGNSFSNLFDTSGTFEISMVVFTNNQCSDTLLDSLVVSPIPVVDFQVSDICFFDSLNLVSNSTVSSGIINKWMWDFSNGFSGGTFSPDSSPTVFFADSGRHYVDLTITSDSGCTNTIQKSFYKYPKFKVDFTYNDTCLGFGQNFRNTTILDGGSFTDTFWYTSDVNRFASTFNYTDTFNTVSSYDISLVMEQDSFCRDTLTQTIQIHPLASPDFYSKNSCLGDSTLFINDTKVSVGSFTSSWIFGDGNVSSDRDPKNVFASGGTKNVNLAITTDEGCVTDTTIQVLITFPEITRLNVKDICENDSLVITADTVRGLDSFNTYSWKYGSMLSARPEVRALYGVVGKTIVTLNVVTKNGCLLSQTDSFITKPKPSPNFFVSGICEGQFIEPIENSTMAAPAVIKEYTWFSDNTLISSDQNPTITSGVFGNRTIKLVVSGDNGCTDSIQKLALVHPVPLSSYTATSMCLGDNNTLTSTSSVATGTVDNLFWLVDGAVYTTASINPLFATDGSYAVELIVESDNGCRDTLNNTVAVHPLPVLSFTSSVDSGCVPLDVSAQSASTIVKGSIRSFTYQWGDGSSTTTNDSSHTYAIPGTYSIKVIGESDQGCVDSVRLSNTIRVFENPVADFTYSPTEPSTLTEFVEFKDSSKGDATKWEWEISDGSSYSGSLVAHNFSDSGSYSITLNIADDNGCEHDTTKRIYVNADLYVYTPNSFTPNGDGLNDRFGLSGVTAGVNKMEMEIYNRWGERIFESSDVNNRWDGTYKGEPVQQGVYIYKVRFTNPKQTRWFFLDGEIHLLRK